MAYYFQVTIDSAAPHPLADWWAEALGWQVEAQDEAFIRRMIDTGYATEAQTTKHRGALVWKEGAAINSPEPGRPRVLFQLVPEGKTVKNRLHLDFRPDDQEAEVIRLLALGARTADVGQGEESWVVLADPEGNEFCVLRSRQR
jgi:hypothetical protein